MGQLCFSFTTNNALQLHFALTSSGINSSRKARKIVKILTQGKKFSTVKIEGSEEKFRIMNDKLLSLYNN